MPALNISLPKQLKGWVTQQIDTGSYASASDYLRDLIREDMRKQERDLQWLADHLNPLIDTSEDAFVAMNAEDIKRLARKQLEA